MYAFPNRRQAGRALAARLAAYTNRADVVVLALPRGGVPVAYEIARALRVPLDLVLVRKLGVPGYPELAMGAIAGGEVVVLNRELLARLKVSRADFDQVLESEREELSRRETAYRGARPPLDLAGRTVILVDDGLATGATMTAALTAALREHATTAVVAVPVAAREAASALEAKGHTVVAAQIPEPFYGVGAWYEDFEPTSDAEVKELLAAAWRADEAAEPAEAHASRQ